MTKRIYLLLTLLAIVLPNSALALDPVYTGFFSNTAIKGYDTVAYFTENKAVEGKSEFQTEYMGATWMFASQAHLNLFKANPEKYAPQYGGYCAYAVAKGDTASIQPDQFTVHEGKLYLNYNASINKKWLQKMSDYIDAADQNWPKLLAE